MRPPSDALRRALSGHPHRDRIDPERARAEHTAYVRALEAATVAVTLLPPEATCRTRASRGTRSCHFHRRAMGRRRCWWRPGPARPPGDVRLRRCWGVLGAWPPAPRLWRSVIRERSTAVT